MLLVPSLLLVPLGPNFSNSRASALSVVCSTVVMIIIIIVMIIIVSIITISITM